MEELPFDALSSFSFVISASNASCPVFVFKGQSLGGRLL